MRGRVCGKENKIGNKTFLNGNRSSNGVGERRGVDMCI